MVIMYTDHFTHSTRTYPPPWPFVLNGFWKPPFMPIFWVYAAVSLYQAYTSARNRQFKRHRRWVIRLNAVLLGVTVGRPLIGFLAVIYVGSPRTSEASRDLLTDCLTYQWNDPRSQDLDFRWTVFWDVIWKGMLGYVVLAEMWLATESYFGLGAVAVRPPPSAGSPTKKSTPAPS
jgi:hypothetical protein